MQKTLSFGQHQATNGRARRVFISSAGRWEWRDGALIAGFSTHVMELLQYLMIAFASKTDENPTGSPVGGLVLAETQSLLHVG